MLLMSLAPNGHNLRQLLDDGSPTEACRFHLARGVCAGMAALQAASAGSAAAESLAAVPAEVGHMNLEALHERAVQRELVEALLLPSDTSCVLTCLSRLSNVHDDLVSSRSTRCASSSSSPGRWGTRRTASPRRRAPARRRMGFLLAKETALFGTQGGPRKGDAKKPATANAVSFDRDAGRLPLRANPIQERISAVRRTTNSGRVPGSGAA